MRAISAARTADLPLGAFTAAIFRAAEHASQHPLLDDPTAQLAIDAASKFLPSQPAGRGAWVDGDTSRIDAGKLADHPLRAALHDLTATHTRVVDRWLEEPTWPPASTVRRQIVLFSDALDGRSQCVQKR